MLRKHVLRYFSVLCNEYLYLYRSPILHTKLDGQSLAENGQCCLAFERGRLLGVGEGSVPSALHS